MSGLRARVLICATSVSSVVVMSLAMNPAQATPSRGAVVGGLHTQIDAARAFNGTFVTTSSSGGPSPHCGPSGWLIDVTGTLKRVGRPNWNLTASACVNASPILPLGSFTITTGSGTILTGTARAVVALPTSSTLTLIVQRASREYTGGTLVITSELATSVAKVTGAGQRSL